MTRRESRGLLVLAVKNPNSWHGLALLAFGFVGCRLCYKHWKIATEATPEQKEQIEKQDEENRLTIAMWLMVVYKDVHEKMCIICSKHGEFWQTLLQKRGATFRPSRSSGCG